MNNTLIARSQLQSNMFFGNFLEGSLIDRNKEVFFLSLYISEIKQFRWKLNIFAFVMVSADDSRNLIEFSNFVLMNEGIHILLNETCVILTFLENWVVKNSFQKLKIVFQSNNFVVLKSFFHFFNGLGSCVSVCDEFGDHRIIESWDGIMFSDTGLNSDSVLFFWLFEVFKFAVVRKEVIEGIFRVNSDFNGFSFFLDLLLFFGKWESTCNEELPFYEIKASDLFRDWMLHLKSGVHFHEVMFVGVEVENEFNSTCIIISNGLCSINCRLTNLRSDWFGNVWWGFFNNFLMSSLNWAVPFVQMNIVFHHITENLYFNMSWLCNVLFDQNSIIAEWFQRFSFAWFKSLKKLLFFSYDSHTFSSTSWNCFNQNRISDLFGLIKQIFGLLIFLVITWNNRNIGCSHNFFAFTFASHWSNGWWRRADEFHSVVYTLLSKLCIFR